MPTEILQRAHVGFVFPDANPSHLARTIGDGLRHLGARCSAVGPGGAAVHEGGFAWTDTIDLRSLDLLFIDWSHEAQWTAERRAIAERAATIPFPGKLHLSDAETGFNQRFAPDGLAVVAHGNRHVRPPSERIACAIGLDEEAASLASTPRRPWASRNAVAVRPFSLSSRQSVPTALDLTLLPRLERHVPVLRQQAPAGAAPPPWTDTLPGSQICLAYAGRFLSDWWSNPGFATANPPRTFHLDEDVVIIGWDHPWLWRSFAAGCLTIALDFAALGLDLPHPPQDGVHYIAIDLASMRRTEERIMDRKPDWERIAAAGQAWASATYHPKETARRVLDQLRRYRQSMRGAETVTVSTGPSPA